MSLVVLATIVASLAGTPGDAPPSSRLECAGYRQSVGGARSPTRFTLDLYPGRSKAVLVRGGLFDKNIPGHNFVLEVTSHQVRVCPQACAAGELVVKRTVEGVEVTSNYNALVIDQPSGRALVFTDREIVEGGVMRWSYEHFSGVCHAVSP